MIYYLINEMSAVSGLHGGHVISKHRTLANAKKAESKIQKGTKKANGPNSFLPLAIAFQLASDGCGPYRATIINDKGDRETRQYGAWTTDDVFEP